MGWLAKLLKPKADVLSLSSKTHGIVSDGTADKDSSVINTTEELVYTNNTIWETKCTSPVENVFYTRKLKLDKLTEYAPTRNEINKYQILNTCSNMSKKRKAGDFDLDETRQTKRQRELVDDNNNIADDELDAEVAMYMENSGPPTTWDNSLVGTSDLEPTQTCGYQTENPSPWLRCVEGCFHSFRPLGITKEPRKGAIRILDPWPCLYRNTQFGELRLVGGLNLEKTPQHWKQPNKI